MLNILNVAQTGLKTSQTQVENVMNNLANENTPGYKKRVVDVSEASQTDDRLTGRGVTIESVSRVTDIYMYQNLIQENSKLAEVNELNSMLADIESIFNETDDTGLSADLDRYFNSLENLRTSPQNEVYKNDLTNNAKALVSGLKEIYSDIENKETISIKKAQENVVEINSILSEIGSLSQQIVENYSGASNDLLDKRDLLEKELSQYIDVEISRDEHYSLSIAGVTAVRFDTNVREVKLIEDYIPQKDIYTTVKDGQSVVPYEDSLISSSWDSSPILAERQTIDLSGVADDTQMIFLGSPITVAVGDDASAIASAIQTQSAGIITRWNENYPDKEIDTITASGTQLTIN